MGRSGKGRRTGRALIMQAICPAGGQHELNRAAGQVRHPVARLARAHVIGGAGHDVAIPVHLGPIRWPAEHGRRPRRGRMPSSTLLGPGGPTGVSITGKPAPTERVPPLPSSSWNTPRPRVARIRIAEYLLHVDSE